MPALITSTAGAPNYHPNSFQGPLEKQDALESRFVVSGDVARYNTGDEDNYTQPRVFWEKVGVAELSRILDFPTYFYRC
jgi:catalase